MLTEQEMNTIAEKYISEKENKTDIKLIIGYHVTIKKSYGNIYFYDSKKRFDTNDDRYAIAGNAPFLVEKETGRVIIFGTAYDDDYYIKGYENGTWKPSSNGVWDPN